MITFTPSAKGTSVSSYTSNESPSSTDSSPNSTLFVGDLSLFTNEVDLYNLFVAFGELVEIKIMRCEETMKNLSYGFVKFVEHEPAVKSMKALHGYILNGRPLRIKWASHKDRKAVVTAAELPLTKPNAPSDAHYMNSSSIHIDFTTDQLDSFVNENILREVFSRYGEVIDITLKKIDIDEMRNIQKGYAFIHYPATAKGVASCLQCCGELKDTIVDGVKYRCDISHKLMKELNETGDPEVLKILERSPALMKTLHRANPVRKTKTRGTVISALSQETTAYQYPFLTAYMTNLNPYATNYVHTGYTIAASTTTTSATIGTTGEHGIHPYISSLGFKSSSSESTSTDSMEGLINQVAFIDTRDTLMAACPSVDFETGQMYTQFGQSCWNIHNASPVRRQSFTGWASEFVPVAPPPPMNPRHSFTSGATGKESIAEDHHKMHDEVQDGKLKIETGVEVPPSHPTQAMMGYQIASPTWYHPVNSVLYPYYSYTQFPTPRAYGPLPNMNYKNGFSPRSRRKSFATIQQNQRSGEVENGDNLPPGAPGLQRSNNFVRSK